MIFWYFQTPYKSVQNSIETQLKLNLQRTMAQQISQATISTEHIANVVKSICLKKFFNLKLANYSLMTVTLLEI